MKRWLTGAEAKNPRRLSIWFKLQVAVAFGALFPFALALWQTERSIAAGEYVLRRQLDDFVETRTRDIALQWKNVRYQLEAMGNQWPVEGSVSDGRLRTTWLSATPPSGWFVDSLPGYERRFGILYPNPMWPGMEGVADVLVKDNQGNVIWRSGRAFNGQATVPLTFRISELGLLSARVTVASLYPSLHQERRDLAIGLADAETGAMLLGAGMDVFQEWNGGSRISTASEVWTVRRQRLFPAPLELTVAAPTSPIVGPIRRTAALNLVALLVGSMVAMTAAWCIAAGVAGSLDDLAEGADAVASGNLTTRLTLAGDDEFVRVARAFNTMAENLTKTLRRLSQRETLAATSEFAARLAHEVRNPLTSVKIDVQRLQRRAGVDSDGTATRLLTQLDRLERYVSDTLGALRWEKRERREIDMADPIKASAHAASPHFEHTGAKLTVQAARGKLWARVDGWAIEQVILNLLINAAQAVGPGGRAWLTGDETDEMVIVEIADNGPGIPNDVRDKVFDVFFTTKSDGSGLGLSIAQEIIEEHGGTLRLSDRPGGGTIAQIRLPSCPAPTKRADIVAVDSPVLQPVLMDG